MRDQDPAYELTMNVTKGTYTFVCREHGIHRPGIQTVQHAANIEAKHVREHHADDEPQALNLSAVGATATALLADPPEDATPLQRAQALSVSAAVIELLEALTGLNGLAAVEQAAAWSESDTTTAHVAPF